MKKSVSTKANRLNLRLAAELTSDLNAFPFYGTLLGLARQGDILEGDDDIDFFVSKTHRETIISRFLAAGFSLCEESEVFLQFGRMIEEEETLTDFYLFDGPEVHDYIIEKHNFRNQATEESSQIRIPVELVFPLVKTRLADGIELLLPKHVEKCCEYIYGSRWRQPYSKLDGGYVMVIHEFKPIILYPGEVIYEAYTSYLDEQEKLSLKQYRRARRLNRWGARWQAVKRFFRGTLAKQ